MATSIGKVFERELFKSFEYAGLLPKRITDRTFLSGNRILSQESEADFWVFDTAKDNLRVALVEAKATKNKSFSLEKLKEHQYEALLAFENEHKDAHGFVAVNFYDKDNRRNFNICYLVPILTWRDLKEAMKKRGRKSIPLAVFETDENVIKCVRIQHSMFDVSGMKRVM